ncbi:MAG: metallophosphoesterase [Saprospiraceae bacterium]|nr:metallophosphoesterase [Saprospiraceae bacterium]
MKRRAFVEFSTAGMGALLLPQPILNFTSYLPAEKLTFGIVADVHHGMIPDTQARLESFIAAAQNRKVDFILQLGDFCHPEEKSKPFLQTWNSFAGPKYHVLGNHDMDLGSKAQIMDLWEMESNYYAFVEKGIRFIVLDANFLYQDGEFIPYDHGNFYVDSTLRTFIDEEQIEWFEGEMAASDLPVIVISHQSLWHYQSGVKNRLNLQGIMEKHADKVICCFNGHNHIDFHHVQNGIHYLEVNSMSYQWIGEQYKTNRYPSELLKDYKWLAHVAPYQDPLYAFVEIDTKGLLAMTGKKSEWMSPSPREAGVPVQPFGNQYSAEISDYTIEF